MLTPRGYDLVTARDGVEALEMVGSTHPDLILLDVMVPGLDGYGVCRRLRRRLRRRALRSTPISPPEAEAR
jgi:CheY-like chemotaxis protein